MSSFPNKSIKLLFLFFSFVILSLSSLAQQNKVDSLLATLPAEKDTNYIVQLQKIIPQFPDRAVQMQYRQTALKLSEGLDYTKGEAYALYAIGKLQRRKDEDDLAVNTFKEVISLAQQIKDPALEFLANKKIGAVLLYSGKSDLAYKYFLIALKMAETSKNELDLAEIFHRIGEFHRLQHNFDEAVSCFEKSASFFQKIGQESDYCWMQSTIAMTYKRYDDIEKKRKGIAIYEALLNGDCAKASSSSTIAKHYNNLGSAYVDIGNLEKGEEVLYKALSMKRELGSRKSLAYTLNEIASLQKAKGDYQGSIDFASEAYDILKANDNIYLKHDVTRNLYQAYSKIEQYQAGFEKLKEYQALSDLILNQEKVNALAEMSSKFELEKKETDLLQKDLLIAQQNSRFNRYLLIGLSILGIVIGFFLWSRWTLQKQKMEAKKLQELDQLKSNFFTNITHEFRTPLTVILNSFSNKKAVGNTVTLTTKEANIIQRNTHRLQSLINQLLDLSKLEAGKMKLQVAENDLFLFLKTLTHSFHSLADQKDIQLHFASQLSSCKIFFDADKIEKILTNLIANAIKFTPEGGEVTVLLLSKEDQVEITVKDNGIGIAPEALPHIFDRFHQTDHSETRNFEGSGIGLALVYQMIKVHRGIIKVESTPAKGSVFTIQLSAQKEHYDAHQIHTAPFVKIAETKHPLITPSMTTTSEQMDSLIDPARPIVLLIEDDPDLRFLLKKQLQNNYQVLEASNGVLGIEMAIDQIPDLIISDVMMPKLGGYDVCDRLKKDQRTNHIPIILLTAKATQKEKLEGLETGADDYLIKPFNKKELALKIHNLISQRKSLQQRFAQEVVYRTKASPVISKKDAFIQQLLEIIENEIANEGFGVEELAKASHMSRSQLYRKLKALTDKTPNVFLREIRLAKAKEFLENDAGTVSEIAMMVGFSNANYFYKCFKDAYGKTPGEVMKLSQQ